MILVFGMAAASAQITTASFSGRVVDSGNLPLIGATVVATHVPSGSQYGTITDEDGYYSLSNMRVGGPYKIDISYVGYENNQQPNMYLALGEKRRYDVILKEGGITLDELVITASSLSAGVSTGSSTNITNEQIEQMPTLNRSLEDYARLTPQFKTTFGGGISFGGQNNRFNSIFVDGAVNNDVFGLADNGQNGGQTGVAPFSIDAIEQIQVVLSPYDVSYGGFAGGGINAVTKSGTNEYKGTAYYFTQNEGLTGKTNKQLADRILLQNSERTRLDEFSNNLYGLSLGGPIIKDKLFFFVNAEIQDEQTPQPFAGDYAGNSSLDDIAALSTYIRDTYGYDPGEFGAKTSSLESTKIFAKLDYNLNQNHKLSFRHNYTKAENLSFNSSGRFGINFANNGIFFPSTTSSSALEVNSQFGTNKSNSLIVGYTTVTDDRDPIGQDFPNVFIRDGRGSISFGSEAFSTANALDQKILTITDNFKLYKGNHTITIGTHNEFIDFYNLFIRQNYGAYFFASLDDFYNGNVGGYDRSYSLVDDITGDGSAAAAEFSAAQFGVYLQDEWALNNKVTLTGGIRLDVPILNDDPNIDASFNTETLPLLQGYDLLGTRGGAAPSGQLMWSPRFGVSYVKDENTRIRGGIGVFTSRVPFVWPGGMYTNNGVTIGGLDERDLDNIDFNADPYNQVTNPDFTVPSGQIDLFADNFKYPQVFRSSLALDKVVGNNWNFSLEGMYTKTLNNVFYQNVNSDPTVDFNWTNGPDNRPIFTNSRLDNTYTAIYLASNTSEGSAYNLTATVNKEFDNGLSWYAAYSYGDASSIFDGTSSQNSSQWRGVFSVDGRNNPSLAVSDFSLGSRVVSTLGYSLDWTGKGDFNTQFNLIYNGQSGNLFSYVYNDRNINNESGSTAREFHLIFVPGSRDEINLVEANGLTPDEQWELLSNFIDADDYLSNRKGQYAERNGSRTPFTHQFDLRIAQDISANFAGTKNKLQLSLDIFNVGNLINDSWGVIYGNPFNYRVLDFQGYDTDGTTPTFSFNEDRTGNDRFNIADRASRWRGRIGLRYIFN